METTNQNPSRSRGSIDNYLKNRPDIEYLKTEIRLLIASKIGDLIEEKGLQKQEAAIKIGVSSPVVSKWLRGDHHFTVDTLMEIGHALGYNFFSLGRINKSHKSISSNWTTSQEQNAKDFSRIYIHKKETQQQVSAAVDYVEINSEI